MEQCLPTALETDGCLIQPQDNYPTPVVQPTLIDPTVTHACLDLEEEVFLKNLAACQFINLETLVNFQLDSTKYLRKIKHLCIII